LQHEQGHAQALGKTFVVGIAAAVGLILEMLNVLFQPLQRRFKVHGGPAFMLPVLIKLNPGTR
jgi:hypothetical protein